MIIVLMEVTIANYGAIQMSLHRSTRGMFNDVCNAYRKTFDEVPNDN